MSATFDANAFYSIWNNSSDSLSDLSMNIGSDSDSTVSPIDSYVEEFPTNSSTTLGINLTRNPRIPHDAMELLFPSEKFHHDRGLCKLFASHCFSSKLDDNDIVAFVNSYNEEDGEDGSVFTSWGLTDACADYLWSPARAAGQINVSAVNGCEHTTYSDPETGEIVGHSPRSIPKDIYVSGEWDMDQVLPHLLCASPIFNPLRNLRLDTLEELMEYVAKILRAVEAYTCWTFQSARSSLRKGFNSQLNYGAVFGLSHAEYLDMVAPGVFNQERDEEEGRSVWTPRIHEEIPENMKVVLHRDVWWSQVLNPYRQIDPFGSTGTMVPFLTQHDESLEILTELYRTVYRTL
ncbi:hypothetical protein C8J56DRAFT_1053924 [Mycena floridula]|nr:hypothetical protein C8J56DRAFT_1053924 [Mycena floridula]